MNAFNPGRREVAFAEKVAQGGRTPSTFEVYISREATLSANLGTIESSRVRCVAVVFSPGFKDALTVMLNRDAATQLRDALETALQRTVLEEFAP